MDYKVYKGLESTIDMINYIAPKSERYYNDMNTFEIYQ